MARIRKNKEKHFRKQQLVLLNKFQELLQMNVQHDFFDSTYFPKGALSVRPTNATILALKQYQLQFRELASGFMLGYGSSSTITPIKELDKPIQLSFFMEINDQKFLNYTNLPFEFNDDQIFYFNNRLLEKEDTENRNLSLDTYVTEEDKIDILPPVFDYDFDDEQYGTEVQVVNALEEVVFEQILEDGAVSCNISLVGEAEGKYALMVDGLEEKIFFLFKGMKAPMAAIDVFIDKDDFGEYSFFDEDEELVKQKYSIYFKPRELRWRYLIIEAGRKQMYKDHEIYDSTKKEDYEPVEFEEVEVVQLETGKEVHSVWTATPIPMEQKQPQKFKLKTKRGKSGVEWIVDLPCISAAQNLKVNLLDKTEIYSELIVYL